MLRNKINALWLAAICVSISGYADEGPAEAHGLAVIAQLSEAPLEDYSRTMAAHLSPEFVARRGADDLSRAFLLAEEVERLAGSGPYWPEFDPMTIPLAIYDGEHTYLFRHPAPPEGFAPVANVELPAQVFIGRYPAIVANTSAEIGDTTSATLMLDNVTADQPLVNLAAVAIHEAFHVFQRERHPGWQANEGDLFVYPIDDAALLALRRLETEALGRAVASSVSQDAACWAGQALDFRRQRFERMDPAFAAYERLTELNEGLAAYVQLRAEGEPTVGLPASGFEASAVRIRAYATGPAFAFLLDRLRPGWDVSFEHDDTQNLDQALQAAVMIGNNQSCAAHALAQDEIDIIQRAAHADATAVHARQVEARAAFDTRPGWRLIVKAADNEPLSLQGFDPLNVERVGAEVLHARFLSLGNDACQLEAMDTQEADIEVLTEGLGPHPLFNGVRQVVIAGLEKPEVSIDGERVTINVPGFKGSFEGASVEQEAMRVSVTLRPIR